MAVVSFELNVLGTSHRFDMDDADGLDHVVALVKQHGLATYEEPYPAMLAALVKSTSGCFLDVGANTGLFALMAASLRTDLAVHAFEPLQSISEVLLRNLALNPVLAARIMLHRIALSDETGVATFFETINPYGLFTTSSGLNAEFSQSVGETREHIVPVVALDALVERHGISDIAFIKIDVEEHEPAVLKGAVQTIASRRPLLGVEMLGGADYAFFQRFIAEHDYLDCILQPGRMTLGRAPAFAADGWNHLLVPRERAPQVAAIAAQIGLSVLE